jgi:hypothetical protein
MRLARGVVSWPKLVDHYRLAIRVEEIQLLRVELAKLKN